MDANTAISALMGQVMDDLEQSAISDGMPGAYALTGRIEINFAANRNQVAVNRIWFEATTTPQAGPGPETRFWVAETDTVERFGPAAGTRLATAIDLEEAFLYDEG
jgi:hypothetical protein